MLSDRPVVQFSADHPINLTLEEGANATFTCKTIGNPPTVSHKWQFNGVDIPGKGCGNGCPTTILTKLKVNQSDTGWYSCTGTNSIGEGPPARAHLLVKCKYSGVNRVLFNGIDETSSHLFKVLFNAFYVPWFAHN